MGRNIQILFLVSFYWQFNWDKCLMSWILTSDLVHIQSRAGSAKVPELGDHHDGVRCECHCVWGSQYSELPTPTDSLQIVTSVATGVSDKVLSTKSLELDSFLVVSVALTLGRGGSMWTDWMLCSRQKTERPGLTADSRQEAGPGWTPPPRQGRECWRNTEGRCATVEHVFRQSEIDKKQGLKTSATKMLEGPRVPWGPGGLPIVHVCPCFSEWHSDKSAIKYKYYIIKLFKLFF